MPQLQNMCMDEGWAWYAGQPTSTSVHELPAFSQSNASVQPTVATRGIKQSTSQHDQQAPAVAIITEHRKLVPGWVTSWHSEMAS